MKYQILNAAFALSLLIVIGCSKENSMVSLDDNNANSATTNSPAAAAPSATAEVTPWGVVSVGGGIEATDKTAWIIDSGIDMTHPDLNIDYARSISFVKGTSSASDEFGHGTYVAGIIGAIKGNGIGLVGVAAGAKLVAVRVLDKNGNGTIAAMVAGINYVAENAKAGDVANISFEVGTSIEIDNAVIAASKKGILFAIAAGNGAATVTSSPARVNGDNIYTVSAIDKNNKLASFSNFGKSIVDFCAPGVDIKSTSIGGGYTSVNGTSMAAPHMAGLLLIGAVKTSGYVLASAEGVEYPIAHH